MVVSVARPTLGSFTVTLGIKSLIEKQVFKAIEKEKG